MRLVTKNRKETTETEMDPEVEEKLLMKGETRKVTPSKYRSVKKVSHSKGGGKSSSSIQRLRRSHLEPVQRPKQSDSWLGNSRNITEAFILTGGASKTDPNCSRSKRQSGGGTS